MRGSTVYVCTSDHELYVCVYTYIRKFACYLRMSTHLCVYLHEINVMNGLFHCKC